jgi:predicted O-linked N-acetylglucosamine transferase (SPINDLY family)
LGNTGALYQTAATAWQAGNRTEARRVCQAVLQAEPDHPDALHLLGVLEQQDGRPAAAETLIRRAIARRPEAPAYHTNLAAVLRSLRRLDQAEAAARQALALAPDFADALNNLGNILRERGHPVEAIARFRKCLGLQPAVGSTHYNLGRALWDCGRAEEAVAAYQLALELDPGQVDAWNDLGAALQAVGRNVAAEAACRQAIALAPTQGRNHDTLGTVLLAQARLDEALTVYRHALTLTPPAQRRAMTILFCANYSPTLSAEDVFAEYRRMDQEVARPLLPASVSHGNTPQPGRRLRVGYVSPDLCTHTVSLFIEPLLAAHDKSAVELFCYAEVAAPDAVTRRLQGLADHWRSTVGLDDPAVADLIRADAIDILVDLGGHTASSRILVFARKPAPVQVTYLLGHGYTSGLSAMDAFLADATLAPAGCEALFSEKTVIRLPRTPLCYQPPEGMPAVGPLPARARGSQVTFGSFSRSVRFNDRVIALWARLLRTVPGARLLLNTRAFAEGETRARFLARFARHGIAPERLELICTTASAATWAAYTQVDIALDPFPHNAGTTTIEALWMGIPVVTLADRPSVGRFGASILGSLGLSEWVATTPDQYVAIAAAAAADLDRLAAVRAGLRPRFQASPLRDGPGLARAIEAAYRQLWQGWCAARTTPPNPISAGEIAAVIALFNAGRDQELEATARALTERCPGDGFGWKALATALIRGRRREEGISAMQRALQCRPEDADAHNNLGIALKELGRFDQAVASYRRALALKPDYIEVLSNLGNALKELGRVDEAEASLRQALALNPDHTEALNNLGYLLTDGGRLHQARSLLQRALALRPGYPEAFNNLGRVHKELGDLEDAVACFRRALALKPETGAYNNLLFCLNYAPELPAEAIFAEYQRWDQSCARPLRPNPLRHDNERSPERRLRVGYVSADFGFHVVSMFFAPLLTAHDRAAVEVFCYSEVRVPDAMTERLRGLADHWRSIVGVKDQAVADLIRADGIDVLVDLTGHTAHGRLLVFARKPAPIQVSYLIGTGYSSGLSAMDAFLADADMVPAGFDHLFSERVIRLPRSPLCYQPPAAMPAVGPLSALSGRLAVPSLGRPLPGPPPQAGEGEERAACFLPPLPRAGEGRGGGLARTGPITFGSFTRTVRINQRVIALWARVLQAVPGSRLLLNNKPFLEADCRALFEARFAAHGITADRLELVYTSPQPQTWAAYNQIDIALDPFPHNAGTTTLEALWMGVPVISLADRPSVGRFGASILGSVGLADWVAATPDQYVAIAVAAAGDLDRLAALRAGLRARVEASPLRDGPGLARAIEEAYRQLWRQWCVGNGVG